MRPDDHALEAAVRKALEDRALDPSFFSTVRDLVVRDSEEWRACCGSGCDPCVLVIAGAVDRARELLGLRP
jgi:hypothetical protein